MKNLNTVQDYIQFAEQQFLQAKIYFGHGTDNAWDEAVFLVLYALDLPPNSDNSVLERKLTVIEKTKIAELIKQRITKRFPLAYLVHEAWFAGLTFYVDERVLIPRSPLAELIMDKFEPWIEYDKVSHILDIGTGSGCIAVACALAFSEAKVDAIDVSSDALEVAKINIARHEVQQQVTFYRSDLFQELPAKKYDIIISNPPYVSENEMQELPQEYCHEPGLALRAGQDGLQIVDRILHEAKNYLTQHGILVVEVGNSAAALSAKYPELPFVWLEFACGESEVFLLDYASLPR